MKAFWNQIEKTPTCWVWKGKASPNGYGYVGALIKVHRLSYELHKGEIPKSMVIKHTCDNKLCVNPEHLKLGTYSENLKEAYERGLRKPKQHQRPSIRLSEKEIEDIQNSPLNPRVLSKTYGISPQRIRSIKSGTVRLKNIDLESLRNDTGTIQELSKKYKISKTLVAKLRDGCYEKSPRLTPETIAQIFKLAETLIFNQHPNYSKIAQRLGVSRQTVKKILQQPNPVL